MLGHWGIRVVVAETGYRARYLSWIVEIADQLCYIYCQKGLLFQLPKVKFNCVLDIPNFFVCDREN